MRSGPVRHEEQARSFLPVVDPQAKVEKLIWALFEVRGDTATLMGNFYLLDEPKPTVVKLRTQLQAELTCFAESGAIDKAVPGRFEAQGACSERDNTTDRITRTKSINTILCAEDCENFLVEGVQFNRVSLATDLWNPAHNICIVLIQSLKSGRTAVHAYSRDEM